MNPNECSELCAKVIVVGETSVGKTCLINALVNDNGSIRTTPTVGSYTFKIEYHLNNTDYSLALWDTGGQEAYRAITKSYFRNAHVAILVFDLTEQISYEKLHGWENDVLELSPNAKFIVVGNKIDLDHSFTIERVKSEFKGYPVFFVSAQNLINIEFLKNGIVDTATNILDSATDVALSKPIEVKEKKKCC